jgi:hypothetical protein
MTNQAECAAVHATLSQQLENIVEIEKRYLEFLVNITLQAASELYKDFDKANNLLSFWIGYAPRQRGRAPKGTSIPWSEVGEKSLSSNLLRAISAANPAITFPGLPFGGDIRFATADALIHFDVKMTGPNDRADEIVAPPQQVSGDGALWDNGMLSAPYRVTGKRQHIDFQPKLPPFYILDGLTRVCLTYFLKAVYAVEEFGVQPLQYLEVACVPNGLLLFDGPRYADTPGLLIPGKDTKTTPEHIKRTRIRLEPLASIDAWRCQQITRDGNRWKVKPRSQP